MKDDTKLYFAQFKHYTKPGPKTLCGFPINRRDHEQMRQNVAQTSDEVTCPRCLELR